MGCSSVRNSQSDLPIEDKSLSIELLPLQVEKPELTMLFNKFTSTINDIEYLRSNLIDKRDSLLFETGACTISSANIDTILKCILQYMSVTSNGNIKSLNPVFDKTTEPYLQSNSTNGKVQSLQTAVNNYIGFVLFFNEDYNRIKNEFDSIMNNEVLYHEDEWKRKACEGLAKGTEEEHNNKKICGKNLRMMTNMKTKVDSLFMELNRVYNIIMNAWNKECNDLTENEQLEEYDKKALVAIQNNYKEIYEIAYYGVDEAKRLGKSPEEKYYEFEQKVRSKNL